MKRPRISLRGLILLLTIAALLLGFAVWRKQAQLAELRAYRDVGIAIRSSEGLFSVTPTSAEIFVTELNTEEFEIAGKKYDWNQVQSRLRELVQIAQEPGVD
jgi:hypothetical protein